MRYDPSTQESIKVEVHYRVFSMTFVSYSTLDVRHKTIPQSIEEFIEAIRKTTSNTAYILCIKRDDKTVYASRVQIREKALWHPKNQNQSA